MDYGAALEMRFGATRRGFESLPLRHLPTAPAAQRAGLLGFPVTQQRRWWYPATWHPLVQLRAMVIHGHVRAGTKLPRSTAKSTRFAGYHHGPYWMTGSQAAAAPKPENA